MKIEHFALNVADPNAMAHWYGKHFGFTVAMKLDKAPYTHFLKDSTGDVMLEIYKNPPNNIPDYKNTHPLQLHLAFVSEDPEADKARLLEAGATFVEEVKPDDVTLLVMMRDPWGLAIQLCRRKKPML